MIHPNGWITGLTSFVICLVLLPVIRRVALRWALHDPLGPLKIHTKPTARLGGVGVAVSLAIGTTVSGMDSWPTFLSFYLALLFVWSAGLIDDLRGLSPATRLVAQVLAGLLISQGPWRLTLLPNPFLDTLATCLFICVFINAFNFLDGADGLAAGVAAVVALGYTVFYGVPIVLIGGVIAWALLGSCLGFLVFNFPPAKIFMGDSGSTTLGFVVAVLGLDFYRVHHALGSHLLLPLVFSGLPLMDFALAILRRLRKRVSPFSGDRQHFYDLLLQRGWSSRRVALGAYATTGVMLIGGWLCNERDSVVSLVVLLVVLGYMSIAAVWLGCLRNDVPSTPGPSAAKTPSLPTLEP